MVIGGCEVRKRKHAGVDGTLSGAPWFWSFFLPSKARCNSSLNNPTTNPSVPVFFSLFLLLLFLFILGTPAGFHTQAWKTLFCISVLFCLHFFFFSSFPGFILLPQLGKKAYSARLQRATRFTDRHGDRKVGTRKEKITNAIYFSVYPRKLTWMKVVT